MAAGDIIGLSIYAAVAFIMAGIGAFQLKSKVPVAFYSGEKPPGQEEISDVSMWNKKHGMMWILYGIVIILSGIAGVYVGTDSAWCMLPMLGGVIAPVIVMVWYHHRLIRRYQWKIRHAVEQDFGRIMEIYGYARRFMAEHGNPDQWGPTNWPPESLIHSDIINGSSYVCICEDRIVGTFFFDQGEDAEPTYRRIEEGTWTDESPYGVIHRLAGDGSVKGIGSFCINWAFRQCGHLRVDTYSDNHVMQNLLKKNGFVYCGIIHVAEDDFPRLAFEKSRAAVR